MFNKKKRASLEISIQAIIIIVLAMTFLGLGLNFIKKQIGLISETAGSVQEQVKQQILDDLRASDKKLSFPTSEVTIEKQGSTVLAIGVKNTLPNQLKFNIAIKVINPTNGARNDPVNTGTTGGDGTSVLDGGYIYNKGLQTLQINEARVYPIKYSAPSGTATKTFELIVCNCGPTATSPCLGTGATACTAITGEYDSKTFFITVT